MKVEWKVRPVTRYIVTRWEGVDDDDPHVAGAASGKSTQHGEYDNFDTAYEVGYALCKAEHDRLGYPVADERIQYPKALGVGVQIGGETPDRFPLAGHIHRGSGRIAETTT